VLDHPEAFGRRDIGEQDFKGCNLYHTCKFSTLIATLSKEFPSLDWKCHDSYGRTAIECVRSRPAVLRALLMLPTVSDNEFIAHATPENWAYILLEPTTYQDSIDSLFARLLSLPISPSAIKAIVTPAVHHALLLSTSQPTLLNTQTLRFRELMLECLMEPLDRNYWKERCPNAMNFNWDLPLSHAIMFTTSEPSLVGDHWRGQHWSLEAFEAVRQHFLRLSSGNKPEATKQFEQWLDRQTCYSIRLPNGSISPHDLLWKLKPL